MPRSTPCRVLLVLSLFALPGRFAWASDPPASAPGPQAAELQHAQDLYLHKDFQGAVKAFRKADKLAPGGCAPCQLGLARAYNRLYSYKDAQKSAAEAVRLAGDDAKLALQATGEEGFAVYAAARNDADLEQAAQLFRRALELSGGKDNTERFNLGAVLLKLHKDAEGTALLQEYLKEEPEGASAEQARSLVKNPERARKNLLPDFALVTLDGRHLSPEELQGKVVLVDFWGTWCGPCRAAVPALRRLAERLDKDKEPFVLLSISTDKDQEVLKKFVAENGMSWPQVWDEGDAFVQRCGVHQFPTYWLVDPQGEIVYSRSGWGDLSEREISSRVGAALKAARKAKS